MNAVNKVRKSHKKNELHFMTEEERYFEDGYYQALDDLQAELDRSQEKYTLCDSYIDELLAIMKKRTWY